jgi:hypothetical protein
LKEGLCEGMFTKKQAGSKREAVREEQCGEAGKMD